jgi:hypothetical protein
MENIHILGVDLAKRTFAICGADNDGYLIFYLSGLALCKVPCILHNGFQIAMLRLPSQQIV